MLDSKHRKIIKDVFELTKSVLLSKGYELSSDSQSISLGHKEFYITGQLDVSAYSRFRRLGFGSDPLPLISLAISYNNRLVFNFGTLALVHNSILRTETVVDVHNTEWINKLEALHIESIQKAKGREIDNFIRDNKKLLY